MTRVGDYDETMDSFSNNGGYWESPGYNIAKNSLGIGGTVAGALELRQGGNLTPWNTGDAFKNAKGWYRNKEGLYERLSKQRGRGGGGYQKSAQRAAGKAGKWFKIGRKLFWVGAVVSVYDGGDALYRNDSNKAEVVTKATVDIVIGAIGVWGGPIGWAIAGTYFILDVSGAFGDWGQPSGLSTEENRLRLQQNFNNRYGSFIKRAEIDFEMECVPSLEDSKQYYLEEREVKIDNLKVNRRKIIFDIDAIRGMV